MDAILSLLLATAGTAPAEPSCALGPAILSQAPAFQPPGHALPPGPALQLGAAALYGKPAGPSGSPFAPGPAATVRLRLPPLQPGLSFPLFARPPATVLFCSWQI